MKLTVVLKIGRQLVSEDVELRLQGLNDKGNGVGCRHGTVQVVVRYRLANLVGDELELHQLREVLVRGIFGVFFEDVDAALCVLGVANARHAAEVVGGAGLLKC